MRVTELLYEKVSNDLRKKIYSGELKAGERLPTEQELMERFEVSRITVKRALEDLKNEGLIYRVRGSGSYVSYDVGHKKTEEDNIYKKVISVVVPFSSSRGGALDIISGVSSVMRKCGYIIEFYCAERNTEETGRLLEKLYRQQVGGIIYFPLLDYDNIDMMNLFYLENFPIVMLDKYYENIPLSSVVSDGRQGMYDATRHLLELGHRRIAFVTDMKIEDATTVRDRYYGYTKAMHEHGTPIEEMIVENATIHNYNEDEAELLLRKIQEKGITAICAVNDYLAAFIIGYLRSHNVQVPEQVSVIGFDDVELNQFMEVALTTVRQDMYQMGCVAGEILLDTIAQKKNLGIRKVLPTKLIQRKSCCKIQ